jgi:hypothetical protein
MDINDVVDKVPCLSHLVTRQLDENIFTDEFFCSINDSPLPSFDILALDKILTKSEKQDMATDWMMMKTKESKKMVIICLSNPRQMKRTSLPSLTEMTYPEHEDLQVPTNPVARALVESLVSQNIHVQVNIDLQVVSDSEVFTQFGVRISNIENMQSFGIDGKTWIRSLRNTLKDLNLIPEVAKVADIPSARIRMGDAKWQDFMFDLKVKHMAEGNHKGRIRSETPRKWKTGQNCETPKKEKEKPIPHKILVSSTHLPPSQDLPSEQAVASPSVKTHTDGHAGYWKGWMQHVLLGVLIGAVPVLQYITEF